MKYYTYMNKNEILSLLAQIPSFNFDVDILQYINTVSHRTSTDINICPELYYCCGKKKKRKKIEQMEERYDDGSRECNRRRLDLRVGEFESRDCIESVIAINLQDITEIRNMKFYYDSIDKLVNYAKQNSGIYYDIGKLAKPISRSIIKRKNSIFSRGEEEEVIEEIQDANYMMLNGTKIMTEQISNMTNLKVANTSNNINEMFDSNINILGHFIQNDINGKIVKPIVMYIEY